MDGEHHGGWFIMENPIKMDDFWWFPHIFGITQNWVGFHPLTNQGLFLHFSIDFP